MFLPVHDADILAVVEERIGLGAARALFFCGFFIGFFAEESEHRGDFGGSDFGFTAHGDYIFEAVHLEDVPGNNSCDVF